MIQAFAQAFLEIHHHITQYLLRNIFNFRLDSCFELLKYRSFFLLHCILEVSLQKNNRIWKAEPSNSIPGDNPTWKYIVQNARCWLDLYNCSVRTKNFWLKELNLNPIYSTDILLCLIYQKKLLFKCSECVFWSVTMCKLMSIVRSKSHLFRKLYLI